MSSWEHSRPHIGFSSVHGMKGYTIQDKMWGGAETSESDQLSVET